jgi:hypothetical protein
MQASNDSTLRARLPIVYRSSWCRWVVSSGSGAAVGKEYRVNQPAMLYGRHCNIRTTYIMHLEKQKTAPWRRYCLERRIFSIPRWCKARD